MDDARQHQQQQRYGVVGLLQRALEFTARPGWERRYAFDPPFDLAPGTKLQVSGSSGIVLNVAPSVP